MRRRVLEIGLVLLIVAIVTLAWPRAPQRLPAGVIKSAAVARALVDAVHEYRDRVGDWPASVEVLFEERLVDPRIVESPFGPAPDGRGHYWIDLDLGAGSGTPADATVVCYDRAALAQLDMVPVVFASDTWKLMKADELAALVAEVDGVTTPPLLGLSAP